MVTGLCYQARHNFPCAVDVAEPDGVGAAGSRGSWGWIHVDNVLSTSTAVPFAIGLGHGHYTAMVYLYAVFKRDVRNHVLDVQDANDTTQEKNTGKKHEK